MPKTSKPSPGSSRSSTTDLLRQIHDALIGRFGPQNWWPGDTPWEIACGAVLTQNTNWLNVERAITRLKDADALEATPIAQMPNDELADLIRPAGYFNVKARRLKALADWWLGSAEWAANVNTPMLEARESILAVNGVGPETADSILLYAFEKRTFVIDAYTKRLLLRHGLISESADYNKMQGLFEKGLAADTQLYNEYHALIVQVGKEYCRPKPKCKGCPLAQLLPHA